jgi:hypothetical protein
MTPLKTRVLEMADDLNQLFAEDIGTIKDVDHCQGSFAGATLRVFRTISSKRSGSRLSRTGGAQRGCV